MNQCLRHGFKIQVYTCPQEHDIAAEIQPEKKQHDGSQSAIGREGIKMIHVNGECVGKNIPCQGHKYRPGNLIDQLYFPVGNIGIDQGKCQRDQ
jgi:hypothetical protein